MKNTVEQLVDEVHESFELLKTLRDEIRVELHLAGMEARAQWHEQLEPHLLIAELAVRDLTATRADLEDTLRRYRIFWDFLRMEKLNTSTTRAGVHPARRRGH